MKKKTLSVLCLVCLLFVFSCSDDETDPLPPATDSFIVAFDTMGGSFIKPQLVAKGALVTQPAAPVREGWTFAGWYRDREGTTAWVYSTDTISADTTLYAKWTGGSSSGELYVSFDTMGGSGIATQVVAAGGLVTQPFMYPDKTGYVFVGWYKETNGITAWNFASDTVSAATTIYAKWAVTPLSCRTNSGIEISKCLTTVSGHINIPNYIAGKPVVRIGKYAFEACEGLTTVSFPPIFECY
ncbi:MAG: Internalin-A precursor [Bacteroidetes bacterium ADurb.Bin416]|nr:MAG: Internalin-A precursor [Bacteroidetes bacterium ADurb.Bin416]